MDARNTRRLSFAVRRQAISRMVHAPDGAAVRLLLERRMRPAKMLPATCPRPLPPISLVRVVIWGTCIRILRAGRAHGPAGAERDPGHPGRTQALLRATALPRKPDAASASRFRSAAPPWMDRPAQVRMALHSTGLPPGVACVVPPQSPPAWSPPSLPPTVAGGRPRSAVAQLASQPRSKSRGWERRERFGPDGSRAGSRRPATSATKVAGRGPFAGLLRASARTLPSVEQRDPFGLRSASKSSSTLAPPPVFGKDARVVRFQRDGPRFQNMEARFVSEQQARQSSYGTHSPGPVYTPSSDFGAVPPLHGSHFLMRTSPLVRLGIGTAAGSGRRLRGEPVRRFDTRPQFLEHRASGSRLHGPMHRPVTDHLGLACLGVVDGALMAQARWHVASLAGFLGARAVSLPPCRRGIPCGASPAGEGDAARAPAVPVPETQRRRGKAVRYRNDGGASVPPAARPRANRCAARGTALRRRSAHAGTRRSAARHRHRRRHGSPDRAPTHGPGRHARVGPAPVLGRRVHRPAPCLRRG